VLLVLLALEAPLAAFFKDVLVRNLVSTFIYNFFFNRLGIENNSLLVAPLDKELVLTQRASYLCSLLALLDIL
jgi:hypothetical protein